MSPVLALIGLGLLALPGVVTSRARHLRPCDWRRLNRSAIRLGFMTVVVGLLLVPVPMVLKLSGVDSVADVCHHVLGHTPPGGAITGGVSLVTSVALVAVAVAAWRRSRRLQRLARIDGWCGEHIRLADATLVVLPTDEIVAYATPGSPAQVVVSRALRRTLGPDELDAVVQHELSHLRNRHHRDLVLAGVVDATFGWIPGVRASTAALRLSIERSADEDAAERPEGRETTRRALVKMTETMLGPVPAFTAAFTLLARLEALAMPPPDPSIRQRAAAFAPLAGLAILMASGLLAWSALSDHSILHLVGDCPLGAHGGE